MSIPQISFVIPLYNEAESLPVLVDRLNRFISSSELSYEVVLVDDGSSDQTEEILLQLAFSDARYQCVFL
ncbi:MAG TPA: glycosyltransferase, partial [Bacteroidia bacterium]|nr:glycosyltransferase [Bacteroidia bacterium]